jgi:hypothetical protein
LEVVSRRRYVPQTISKRLRRKLRRSQSPYLLWLRCRKPRLYARLQRMWLWKMLDTATSIAPCDTPLFCGFRKFNIDDWKVDP